MLTISSIGVMPWPQQAPTTKVQPVTATKTSDAVSSDNAKAVAAAGASGDPGRVQAAYVPSAMPPVEPTAEAMRPDMPNNAQAPERSGLGQPAPAVAQEPPAAARQGRAARQAAQAEASSDAADKAEARKNSDLQRYKGELPEAYRSPVQEAMDTQIKELLPNMWAASRAAVDVLIGEEARAAAAARVAGYAEKTVEQAPSTQDKGSGLTDTYVATQSVAEGGRPPGQVVNTQA